MSPLTETDWHRRQIMAFIRAEPVKVSMLRPVQTETEAGGRVTAVSRQLPEQTFRLTPFKRRLTNETWMSNDGERVKIADWVLHGAHNADVELKDYFYRGKYRYEVVWVSDHRLYRTAAGLQVTGEVRKV